MMFWNRKSGHFPVLERPFPGFFVLLGRLFCPGTVRDRGVCPGTFAPALVPGQRDTVTRIFFFPGQRDNGTSRPGLSRDVPSLGNTSLQSVLRTYLARDQTRCTLCKKNRICSIKFFKRYKKFSFSYSCTWTQIKPRIVHWLLPW